MVKDEELFEHERFKPAVIRTSLGIFLKFTTAKNKYWI